MGDEIDIDEVVDLAFREGPLEDEELPIEGVSPVRPTAASIPARSLGLIARISARRPSRSVSVAK